jgi:hypothetical protein
MHRACNQLGKVFSRSHHAVIRVYDDAGNVIETHEHAGDFKEGCYQRILVPRILHFVW